MKLVVLVIALVACKKEESQPKLPGALYFMRDELLVKLEGGKEQWKFDGVGAPLFPSPHALPDGRVVGIASEGTGEPGSEQLVLIGPGMKVERFGPANTQVRSPAVDPNGKWIVIESKVEPQSELYLIDVATQQVTQLTNNPEGNFTPAALDARTVVFSSSRDGDAEIYKLDVITKEATRLTTFHKDDWSPQPSPDGKTIAFLSDREGLPRIFLVDPDGTNLRRLTKHTADEEAEPVWSPDGKSIAYTKIVRSEKSRMVMSSRIHLHEVATGTDRPVAPDRDGDSEPAFSPDGKWLAIKRAGNAFAISASGGKEVQLTYDHNSEPRLPRWFPR